MSDKKQKRKALTGRLTTLAAVVTVAVSAAPVAWADSSNQPTPQTLGAGKDRGWVKATSKPPPQGFRLDLDVEALDVVKLRSAKGHRTPVGSALHGTSSGNVGLKSAHPAGNGIIAILIG